MSATIEVLDLKDVMSEVTEILRGSAGTSLPVGSAVAVEESVTVIDERTWS